MTKHFSLVEIVLSEDIFVGVLRAHTEQRETTAKSITWIYFIQFNFKLLHLDINFIN